MASKSKHRIARFLSLVWVCSRLVACGGHVESDPYGPCTKSSDCPQGICVAGRCQPLQTIDPDADANVSTDSVEPADAIVSPNDGADLSAEGDGLPSDNDAPPGDSSIVECSSNAECGELQKTLASCLAAYCDPASKRCKIKAVEDGTFCDDLNACTVGDRCKSGVCTGLPKCQASPCQTSSCNPQTGQCASKPLADGSLCDDGDPCTPTDRCVKGECRSSVNICPCTTDASCGIYENGDLCDGTYLCDAGYCRIDPKTRVTCEGLADGPCQTAICDPDSGGCKVVPLDDGTSCSDGNPCTVGDKCQKGVCLGARLDCSSEDRECRTGICDPATGVCRAVPIENGTVCDDGDLCTVESVCTNGLCLGTPKVCVVAGNPCKQGFCDPGTGACRSKPINEGGECDDGDPCTSNDVCLGGVCGGVTESYGAICTLSADAIGICDTAGICQETTIALWGGPKLFGLLSTAFEAVWTTRNGPLLVAALGVGPDVGSLTESRVLVPFELGTPLEDKPLAAFFGALGGRYLGFAPSVALRVDGGGL
ncbi:MAG: hypothetical protein KC609_03990, partial [Myxococcales bacterium]|nr:hypothetical protein [Myxococcales bacterium]